MNSDLDLSAPPTALEGFVDTTAGRGAAGLFASLSAWRHRRVFHPVGVAFAGGLEVGESAGVGVPLLDQPAHFDAILRVSRGLGVPEPWPDVLGVAVRVAAAHGTASDQDFLLATGARPRVLRHLVLPARDYLTATYSTILPFRAARGRFLLGARAVAPSGTGAITRLEQLTEALLADRVRFELLVARPAAPWRRVGELRLHHRLSDDEAKALAFNPYRSGGGIEPAGIANALRRRSYAASQQARATPSDGSRRAGARRGGG